MSLFAQVDLFHHVLRPLLFQFFDCCGSTQGANEVAARARRRDREARSTRAVRTDIRLAAAGLPRRFATPGLAPREPSCSPASSFPIAARSPAASSHGAAAALDVVAATPADRGALFTRLADETHEIGEGADGYLDAKRSSRWRGGSAPSACIPATASCRRTPTSLRCAKAPASSSSGRRRRRCGRWG